MRIFSDLLNSFVTQTVSPSTTDFKATLTHGAGGGLIADVAGAGGGTGAGGGAGTGAGTGVGAGDGEGDVPMWHVYFQLMHVFPHGWPVVQTLSGCSRESKMSSIRIGVSPVKKSYGTSAWNWARISGVTSSAVALVAMMKSAATNKDE